MAYIRQVSDGEATGLLAKIYESATKRAGRVFGILRVQSQNPEVLQASISMYQAMMFGPSPLTRAQREMLATVTSRANDCFYWVRAHANDFRSEVTNESGDADAAARLADAVMDDWRTAGLSAQDRALCEYAEKATLRPQQCGVTDVIALRTAGFDDRAITDATQVVAYFNYINRIADCLGVDLEPEMQSE